MPMRRRILTLTCANCGKEVIHYCKIGKGSLIRCWKNRIIKQDILQKDTTITCTCGNILGINKNLHIQIKKHHIHIQKK